MHADLIFYLLIYLFNHEKQILCSYILSDATFITRQHAIRFRHILVSTDYLCIYTNVIRNFLVLICLYYVFIQKSKSMFFLIFRISKVEYLDY